jgi:hypothetical protein
MLAQSVVEFQKLLEAPVALNTRAKQPFKLAEKFELSHDTTMFRFALQSPLHRYGPGAAQPRW